MQSFGLERVETDGGIPKKGKPPSVSTRYKSKSCVWHPLPIAVSRFKGTGTPGIILDYIYVSKKITVLTHAVELGTVDGHFPSDHMPVLIDFLIN